MRSRNCSNCSNDSRFEGDAQLMRRVSPRVNLNPYARSPTAFLASCPYINCIHICVASRIPRLFHCPFIVPTSCVVCSRNCLHPSFFTPVRDMPQCTSAHAHTLRDSACPKFAMDWRVACVSSRQPSLQAPVRDGMLVLTRDTNLCDGRWPEPTTFGHPILGRR